MTVRFVSLKERLLRLKKKNYKLDFRKLCVKLIAMKILKKIEEIGFARALPHEIDKRRLPNLGDIHLLAEIPFRMSKKQFLEDFENYQKIKLTKERKKLALDGLKMTYLAMNLEDQLETADKWKEIL